jgi:hypothetical protein
MPVTNKYKVTSLSFTDPDLLRRAKLRAKELRLPFSTYVQLVLARDVEVGGGLSLNGPIPSSKKDLPASEDPLVKQGDAKLFEAAVEAVKSGPPPGRKTSDKLRRVRRTPDGKGSSPGGK